MRRTHTRIWHGVGVAHVAQLMQMVVNQQVQIEVTA